MNVAFDSADDHLADRLGARLGQERAKDRHTDLHGIGSQQHLWYEQDAVAEVLADDLHAGYQGVIEHLLGDPAP